MLPKISNIPCHFVIWGTVPLINYCCSLHVKVFAAIPKKFWAGYATVQHPYFHAVFRFYVSLFFYFDI